MRLITLSQISGDSGYDEMFDGFVEDQTEIADEIRVTFDITGFNCVAILNTYGVEASLTIGSTTQTVSLVRDSVKDWWDYWFAPNRIGKDVVFYFPTVETSADATLVISYPGGTAKCGLCVAGVAKHIARTLQDVQVGISDYSKIITDDFGRTYFNVGKWAKREQAGLFLYNTDLDIAYREVVKNRAQACVFDYNEYTTPLETHHTSDSGYGALIVYGYTEDFEITMTGPIGSNAKHESQGLI